jgi:hypothetical protein
MARSLERSSPRAGLVQRILARLRCTQNPAERPRDIAADAVEEDEVYLARHPEAGYERRVLACMRSLVRRSPTDLLRSTYGPRVVEDAVQRWRADAATRSHRGSIAHR